MSDEDHPLGDIRPDNISDGPDFGDLPQNKEQSEEPEKKDSAGQYEGGEPNTASSKKFKNIEEVTFPSLDEALNMKFELNNITNIQQRFRNINCQPREIK